MVVEGGEEFCRSKRRRQVRRRSEAYCFELFFIVWIAFFREF